MYDYLIATDEGLEMAQEGEKEGEKEKEKESKKDDSQEDSDLLESSDAQKEDEDLLGSDKEDASDKEATSDKEDAVSDKEEVTGDKEEAADAMSENDDFSMSGKEDDFSMSDDDDDEEPPMLDGEEPVAAAPTEDYAIARGIDFESRRSKRPRRVDVSAVINYTLPTAVASYIHRIGRTARAEKLGTALSFVDPEAPEDTKILSEIQKHNPPREGHPVPQRLPFDVREVESFTYR